MVNIRKPAKVFALACMLSSTQHYSACACNMLVHAMQLCVLCKTVIAPVHQPSAGQSRPARHRACCCPDMSSFAIAAIKFQALGCCKWSGNFGELRQSSAVASHLLQHTRSLWQLHCGLQAGNVQYTQHTAAPIIAQGSTDHQHVSHLCTHSLRHAQIFCHAVVDAVSRPHFQHYLYAAFIAAAPRCANEVAGQDTVLRWTSRNLDWLFPGWSGGLDQDHGQQHKHDSAALLQCQQSTGTAADQGQHSVRSSDTLSQSGVVSSHRTGKHERLATVSAPYLELHT